MKPCAINPGFFVSGFFITLINKLQCIYLLFTLQILNICWLTTLTLFWNVSFLIYFWLTSNRNNVACHYWEEEVVWITIFMSTLTNVSSILVLRKP